MQKYIIYGVLAVALSIFGWSLYSNSLDADRLYNEKIETQRKAKNNLWKVDEKSPLYGRKDFGALNYYPPDRGYVIETDLQLTHDTTVIELPTGRGRLDIYTKYAYVSFKLKGQSIKLYLLKSAKAAPASDTLFLPFMDETSARETYGAGRYLDIELPQNGSRVIIDFNLCYNPFCAYDSNYSCPMPPVENHLKIPIEAGEKNFIPTAK